MKTPTLAPVDFYVQNNQTWQDSLQFDPPADNDGDSAADDTDQDSDDVPPAWTLGPNLRLDIKGNPEDTNPLLTITNVASTAIVIDDTVNRIMHFNVPEATLSAALTPGNCYYYDLIQFDNSTPAVRTPLCGGEFHYTLGITGG